MVRGRWCVTRGKGEKRRARGGEEGRVIDSDSSRLRVRLVVGSERLAAIIDICTDYLHACDAARGLHTPMWQTYVVCLTCGG